MSPMSRHDEHPQQPDSSAIREAARLLYETTPGATFEDVAAEFGVTSRTLKRWSSGAWKKAGGPVITAKAHAAADRITRAVEQAGPEADESRRQAAADAERLEAAVDERAGIITRHRGEWGIIRGSWPKPSAPVTAQRRNSLST